MESSGQTGFGFAVISRIAMIGDLPSSIKSALRSGLPASIFLFIYMVVIDVGGVDSGDNPEAGLSGRSNTPIRANYQVE